MTHVSDHIKVRDSTCFLPIDAIVSTTSTLRNVTRRGKMFYRKNLNAVHDFLHWTCLLAFCIGKEVIDCQILFDNVTFLVLCCCVCSVR